MTHGFAASIRRYDLAVRSLALSLLVLAPVAAKAVMPLSPQLDRASELALVKALGGVGLSETGSSAVLSSLTIVLGAKPTSRRHNYRERHQHLPDVNSRATPAGRDCASVDLTVLPKVEPRRPIAVRGVYCLSDPARYVWTANSLSVRAR